MTVSVLHVIPVGVVQVSDFVTDIICLKIFFDAGMVTSFAVGVGAVACSTISALLLGIYSKAPLNYVFNMRSGREKLLFALLTPLNLHTLFVGLLSARDSAKEKASPEELTLAANRQFGFACFKAIETGFGAAAL